ncbi:hypothetical protein FACS189432_08840 [Bacteroidia bacterium]|nr:hypothetical protein FACS189432_08840 [Bacteroidia bacterium]
MMNLQKQLLIIFFIQISISLSAQDLVAAFLDKHEKDDNLEVVSIGKKMVEMMCGLSSDNTELQAAIKGLENICIVSSKDAISNKEYYESAQQLLCKNKGFEEILSISGDNEDLLVMIKESKGIVKELVLLSGQDDKFNLIFISGNINLNTLIKYSENLNIKGFNNIRSVERKK